MPGELRFDPLNGAELHVFGEDHDPMHHRGPQVGAIHGQSVKGKAITLLDPILRRGRSHLMSGVAEEEWGAATVIVGEHSRRRSSSASPMRSRG